MIPEGFEEVIPDGFEEVGAAKPLPASSPGTIEQTARNALGGIDAATSMLAGMPSYVASGLSGLGKLITTGDIDQAGNTVKSVQQSNFGFGAPQPFTPEGQQASELLGKGMDFVKEKAGNLGASIGGELGRTNAEIAAEGLLNLLPLPGGKGIHEFGKIIERKLGEKAVPVKSVIPEGFEEVKSQADGNTWMEQQMQQGAARDALEQVHADKNNIQGELDLRPKEMPLDENGMPVDMEKSLDVQNAGHPEQPDIFDENFRAEGEQLRAQQLAETQAREQNTPIPEENPAVKQQQIEEAYQAREAERTQQVKEEHQWNKYDEYSALQDQLRNSRKNRQRGGLNIQEIADGFEALLNGKRVGYLKDNLKRGQAKFLGENANVDIVKVDPEVKGQGIGSALYQAFHDKHEGQIAPSGKTSKDAWNVWKRNYPEKVDAFVAQEAQRIKEGASPQMVVGNVTDPAIAQRVLQESQSSGVIRSPGNRQGGAINFEGISEGLKKFFPSQTVKLPGHIEKIVGKNTIPKDPLPADILKNSLAEGKDTDAYNWTRNTASGATLEAMTRKSALLDGVQKTVQNALKRAELYTQKTVAPIEKMIRQMPMKDVSSLGKAIIEEQFNGERFSAEQLEAKGLNEKQLHTYAAFRQLRENTLYIQNQARTALGLKPITALEHGMTSVWRGDFRQPVYDKAGKLQWYLAADSKWGLDKQAKALKAVMPDLVIDPKKGHQVTVKGSKNDVQALYTTMLDVLGRDDPAVQAVKQAYEDSVKAETRAALGQEKHAKQKANVRGFVGDRPGFESRKEMLEMFQEQMQQAKNAYKWSSLQEAGSKIKEVLSDEKLQEQQPKNVQYAQDYFKNNLGHGTAQWISGIENAFREVGVSPSVLKNVIGNTKSFFITQKLAGSLGNAATNVLQVLNTVPHLIDTMVKQGGNPVKALGAGLIAGTSMGAAHYLSKMGKDMSSLTKNTPFLRDAFQYAEDNGITSRSINDEAPINKRGIITKSLNIFSKSMSVVETFTRSAAYMSFAQMLKDSGKFKDNQALFQKAEQLTNASMVDYRSGERPMLFSKLGIAGDALNTLQTYPANFYNTYRYFGKEALRGNPLPLLGLLTIQYAIAGIAGAPLFNDIDKLFTWSKGKVSDDVYAKIKDFDPKLWVIDHLGESALSGALSTHSGIGMSGRLTAPGIADMAQSPGAPIADIVHQIGSVANAAINPSKTSLAQAVHDVAPAGLQGLVETGLFKDQNSVPRTDGTTLYKKASDLESRQGQYARTPQEETIRKLGLRSQRETLSNDLTYKTEAIEHQVAERSKGMVERFYDAVRQGNTDKASDIQTLYTKLNGTPIADSTIENKIMEEYTTTFERKASSAQQKLNALQGIARMQKIMKERDAAHPRNP